MVSQRFGKARRCRQPIAGFRQNWTHLSLKLPGVLCGVERCQTVVCPDLPGCSESASGVWKPLDRWLFTGDVSMTQLGI